MTPGGTSAGLAALLIVALMALFLLAGCVHVVQEPGLPMPKRPVLHFFRCGDGWICLTEADANALLRYTQQLDAFDAARAELLK